MSAESTFGPIDAGTDRTRPSEGRGHRPVAGVLLRRPRLRAPTRMGDQAAFVSAGGYHHHIGLNTWESKGGPPPPPGTTGLYHVAIRYPSRAALGDALRRLGAGRHPARRRLRPRRQRGALPPRPGSERRRALPRPAAGRMAARRERRPDDVHEARRPPRASSTRPRTTSRCDEAPLRGLRGSRPVSRILSRVTIPLGRRLPGRLERCTRPLGGQRHRGLLHLAPDGVWLAAVSPRRWWALTPPFHPYLRRLRRERSPVAVSFLCHYPSAFAAWGLPSVLPFGVRTFLELSRLSARSPGLRPDCSPRRRLPSRSAQPHSGQKIDPSGNRRTNSPQTRHSRLAPRTRAYSSWSSDRFSSTRAPIKASGRRR